MKLIDLYNQTPQGMMFLFSIFFVVYAVILWKVMGWYYGKTFRICVEAFRVEFKKLLDDKDAEIERIKRTGHIWK